MYTTHITSCRRCNCTSCALLRWRRHYATALSESSIAALFSSPVSFTTWAISDLSKFPDFVEPEGVAHWQLEKDATITKYGEDSHEANVAIAREIGLPEKSIWLIDNISFSQLENIVADENFERKIVEYADSRVGPHGVVSLEGRFADALERYTSRYPNRADAEESYRRFAAWAKAIEQQVFGKVAMAPEDITEHSIQPLLEQLRGHLVH